ncbi:MAG: Arc family DNA-binding protein [Muribaculaceae bacterium]|nr:Arc family DNA-binding protein [Muribaculaceae bacterium]
MGKQANKGFLLRLDPEMMEQVEKWAAQEFRSVNGQIQWIISESLKRHGRSSKKKNDDQEKRD